MSPLESYCSRLGWRSARTARSGLHRCLELAGIQEGNLAKGVTYADSAKLVRELHDRYRARTAAKLISFWREMIRECWRLGYMDKDAAERAMPRSPSRPVEPPAGRHLSEDELRALASACGSGACGCRNEVLLCLLGAGLRRSEIIGLKCCDWSGGLLRVRGKGGRIRELRMPLESAEAMDLWLATRGDSHGDAPLVCAVRGGRSSGRALSESGVRTILSELAHRAGVSGLTPHDFRRTFAGEALSRGADIGVVMRLMGHADPSTTLRYDRRPAEAAWEWSQRLGSPLRGLKQETPSIP